MGTFRTLCHDRLACPACGGLAAYRIQFKYGPCWECDDVRIGVEIIWGDDLIGCYGRPVGGRVQIDGATDPCPHCRVELEALLTIEDNRLIEAELVRELPDLGPEGVLQLGGQHPIQVLDAVKGKNRFVECPHCEWKSDTCIDAEEPGQVYCQRCGGGISRQSWLEFRVMTSLPPPGRLDDGVIELVARDASPLRLTYWFEIRRLTDGARVGAVMLRLDADDPALETFVGHVSYEIDPEHRGRGFAARACRLLRPLAQNCGFLVLWIMASPDNLASIRTIEALGGEYVDTVEIPIGSDILALGISRVGRYRWRLGAAP